MTLIITWLVGHVGTWLTPLVTLIVGAIGMHAINKTSTKAKVSAAQVKVEQAQMQTEQANQKAASAQADAQAAQAETAAVKQAAAAEKNAAAIPDDQLDDAGKSRGLLRD